MDRSRPSPEQLRRSAVVYIRQSSAGQVMKNVESRELQYEFTERAVSLGWHRDQVKVIDEDLGRRASHGSVRVGFEWLAAEVGLRHVGIVLGREVSRLARTSAEWYSLMDLCALTDTLIADGDGVYHPGDYNSRLLLGLKGNMAEAELHLIRTRLIAGRDHKAAKGLLVVRLPVGLDYNEEHAIVLSADDAVRAALSEVFTRFKTLSSARQVVLSLRDDGLKLPRRKLGTTRTMWEPATYRAVREMLTNPAYAGAFVFGRRRQEKSLGENGRVVTRRRVLPRGEWGVCILNHHPGYITWDTYLEHQERLAANRRPERGQGGGAPREGRALLQGLVRCGHCARRMQVAYPGTSAKPHTYLCARASFEIASPVCQRIGGRRVDEAVLDAVFEALEPASLQVTAKALSEVEAEHQRSLHAFEVALERARFEAERARRQFDAVEPENRLVARNLEAEWEARLVEVSRAEAALNDRRARRPVSLTAEEVAWLERAGADLRAVFEAPTTTMTERKQLLRLVLAEVIITSNSKTKKAAVRICFAGGISVERAVPPPRPGNHVPATDEDTVELVHRLASHYNDTLIAQILSRQGRKTATGLSFTRERVKALRHSHDIPVHQPRPEPKQDGAIISLTEAERALGVSGTTLYRWLREGFIAGTQLTPGGPWHIRVDDQLRAKIVPDVPPGWVGLNEAAHALGVARQTVLDRVSRGELRAVHVKRGQRSGLAIEIGAAHDQCGRLFG
jgi:DNA invertase Pin-like site-specific DNA recombinase